MKVNDIRENIVVKITDASAPGGFRVVNSPTGPLVRRGLGDKQPYKSWGAWCLNITAKEGVGL